MSEGQIRTMIDLPDEAVPLSVIELVEYLDEDSERCFKFRTQGTESTAMILGLLELAKRDLIRSSRFPDDTDND